MQVDPKPSPWPCVVMLVGLLLFCLTVPQYWQDAPDDSFAGDEFTTPLDETVDSVTEWVPRPVPPNQFAFGQGVVGFQGSAVPNAGLLTLSPTPTIEELVESARLGSARFDLRSGSGEFNSAGWPTFGMPEILSGSQWPTANAAVVGTTASNPLLTAAMERIGQALAVYSFAEALPQLVARAANLYRAWAPERTAYRGPSPNASTLRLIGPDDHIAMRQPAAATESSPTMPLAEPQRQFEEQSSSDPWCVPQVLYEQLERLSRHPYSAQWAQATIAQLRAITKHGRLDSGDVPNLLLALSRSAQEAVRMAEETGEDRLRVELLRAHWGLARRLDCWTVIHDIRVAELDGIRIASRGSLHHLLNDRPGQIDERADEAALTSGLERYERSRDPQLGRQLAERRQSLESSSDSLDRTLADAVEQHYRNANVRVAITATMLNRLIGGERSEMRPVRDRIAGTPVRGQSVTMSQSRVRLEPATGHWHLDVEAQGIVKSDTLANGGHARLRSFGTTDFAAQKTVVVDTQGVHLQPTFVEATNHSRLAGVTTDFDWVPLFGSYARGRAVDQYRAKRPRAKAEVEYKVAAQATDAMDRETLAGVERVEREVHQRFSRPMAEFGVELTPIELTTTQERMVARMRVAGNHQLGAHTPRPRALSDSLASLQIHETALTNAAVSMALDSRRITAVELQALLREKFPRMASETPPDADADTVFEFAYRNAVQFRIEGGRLEIMLSLANFEHQGRGTRDFIVHAFYAPAVDGLSAELVREGGLGIEGRLSSTERARLHNAFNCVLSPERHIPVVRLAEAGDPRLQGLMITQMVLEDGWVGLAIGPGSANRAAERSRSLR